MERGQIYDLSQVIEVGAPQLLPFQSPFIQSMYCTAGNTRRLLQEAMGFTDGGGAFLERVEMTMHVAAPARQLPNLKNIPQLLVVGEASNAASVNRCVSRYLTQAGVKNTWVDLGSVGIHGNGHMMMLEKNELEIAAFLAGWLRDNVEGGTGATTY